MKRNLQDTGLDYADPFLIKEKKDRESKIIKAYICFATKANHLELVTDLLTHTFLLSLKRFIARRGKPLHLYSDNGKTFVGANRELKELRDFLCNDQSRLEEVLSKQGINWYFMPAYAPRASGRQELNPLNTIFEMGFAKFSFNF